MALHGLEHTTRWPVPTLHTQARPDVHSHEHLSHLCSLSLFILFFFFKEGKAFFFFLASILKELQQIMSDNVLICWKVVVWTGADGGWVSGWMGQMGAGEIKGAEVITGCSAHKLPLIPPAGSLSLSFSFFLPLFYLPLTSSLISFSSFLPSLFF